MIVSTGASTGATRDSGSDTTASSIGVPGEGGGCGGSLTGDDGTERAREASMNRAQVV